VHNPVSMHREHEDRNPGRILLLSALLFTASGFTALVYEVAWERMLGIFSGVHLYSSAACAAEGWPIVSGGAPPSWPSPLARPVSVSSR